MTCKRELILHWAEQGHIKAEDIQSALEASDANPSNQEWLHFLKSSCLWLGITAIAAATIFFFAFNWQSISTLTKFTLLQGFMVCTTIAYLKVVPLKRPSTAITFLIAMLTGALLALSGQVYQTGADPWQLFAIWALLITPFALLNHSSALWVLWILLINLALLLYSQTFRGLFGFLFREEELLGIFLLFNSLSASVFEVMLQLKKPPLKNRYAPQLCLLISGFIATWLAIWAIFDSSELQWGGPVYLIWIGAVFYYYRHRQFDLFILSGCVGSGIVAISCFLINLLGDAMDGGAFLFISLIIIGLSTSGGMWLKKLSQIENLPSTEIGNSAKKEQK